MQQKKTKEKMEDRNYETIEKLGYGEYGSVDRVRDPSGKHFALKRISKLHPKYQKKTVQNEIDALYALQHESICDIIDDWETETEVCILMEYIEGLDLVTILEEVDFTPLEEEIAANLFQQLAEALLQCHTMNIAHRDIKLENVMVDSDGRLKLIDFGLAKMNHPERCKRDAGTLQYCAPEICRKESYDAFKSDIWSCGVLLYALLHGTFPFTMSEIRSFQEGATSVRSPKCSTTRQAADLIQKMLSFNPKDRPTMEEVLQHPWLRSMRSQSSESSES